MVSEIMKDDLKLESAFDLVKFGVQIAAMKDGKMSEEMETKAEKV